MCARVCGGGGGGGGMVELTYLHVSLPFIQIEITIVTSFCLPWAKSASSGLLLKKKTLLLEKQILFFKS